jgi:hypothetical protein
VIQIPLEEQSECVMSIRDGFRLLHLVEDSSTGVWFLQAPQGKIPGVLDKFNLHSIFVALH